MKAYIIESRHASGSSHWDREPDTEEFETREAAEAVIATLETEDDDGAALEYRVVESPEDVSRLAYVSDETSRVERVIGLVVDGSPREARLVEMAPAGTSLVALECDASIGDRVVVDASGVASEVAS